MIIPTNGRTTPTLSLIKIHSLPSMEMNIIFVIVTTLSRLMVQRRIVLSPKSILAWLSRKGTDIFSHRRCSITAPPDNDFEPYDGFGCWYAYCKQGWVWGSVGDDFTFLGLDRAPPVFHYCSGIRPDPSFYDPTSGEEYDYMDTWCDPGDNDVSMEREWLSLFWRLYADDLDLPGDQRFSISDVLSVFGDGDGYYDFQKSYNAAKNWDLPNVNDKFDNFNFVAQEQGLIHCEGGCNLW